MSANSDVERRAREIFLSAVEILNPAQRAEFLNSACGDNLQLRRRLDELLAEQAAVGNFLETPVLPGTHPIIAGATEQPGDRIDRYKLLQKIGEGGAGVVYMAEQEQPVRRRVALKVIKLGMDTKAIIARFEAERQALAMMEHPNIAKVLDAGATSAGRPFFVMELVRGVKINDYCDQHHLPPNERLELFIQVCQAIQHAHQKGIIHRDIKPSNILVTLHDVIPVPKVIDFGIAKATEHRLTDKTLFTEFTTFIGTPAYMSPEQAEMSGLDIDTRSDIYSLGVLLYELLTGKTPFDAEALLKSGLDECRRTIREREPVRPSTRVATLVGEERTTTAEHRQTDAPKLIHLLSGDLDWIVMKCLEKDRTRRYATAHDLADDVQRYLDGEPVEARPPSSAYRFQKYVRRHRGAFAAAAGIVITLLAGAGLSAWQAVRAIRAEHIAESAQLKESTLRQQAEREQARAETGEAAARLNEYVADINLAQQSLDAGNYGRAMQLLNKHRPQAGTPDLRGFEWRYLRQLCQGDEHTQLAVMEEPVQAVAFSPSGEFAAVGLFDKLKMLSVRSKEVIASVPHGVMSMVFSPDGQILITASSRRGVRIYHAPGLTEIKHLPEDSGPIAMSSDGKLLATLGWDSVQIYATASWTIKQFLPGAIGPLAFSPDSKALVSDSKEGLTLWTLDKSRPPIALNDSTNLFGRGGFWFRADRIIAFSPDGKQIVAARNTLSDKGVFVLNLWDAASGQEVSVMPRDPEHIVHTGVISSLAFSPDGATLATASMDHSIRLWDMGNRKVVAALQGHLNEVWAVAFSPDGLSLLTGAKDGSVNLWPVRKETKDDVLPGGWQPLGFSKNGQTVALLGRQNAITFLNPSTRQTNQSIQLESLFDRGPFRPPPSFALSADLRTLAQSLPDGTVKFWNTETRESTTLKVSQFPIEWLALSPDGGVMISGGRGHSVRCWDLRNATNIVIESELFRPQFSPDGRSFASATRANTVEIWDTASCTMRTNFVLDAQPGPLAFSPDGRSLAIVSFDDTVRMYDTATCKFLGAFTGHKQAVISVAFSPDGKTLATASDDSTLKFWNVATQQELLTIRRLGGGLRSLLFSPNGTLLVGGSSFSSPRSALRFYRAPQLLDGDMAANR